MILAPPPSGPPPRQSPAPSRILTLLQEADGQPIPLGEIARGIGAAKSSTFNLCQALEEGNMIVRTSTGYLLGRRTVELGGSYISRFNPVRDFYSFCAAAPLLRHELVQIAVLDGTDVFCSLRHKGAPQCGWPPESAVASSGSDGSRQRFVDHAYRFGDCREDSPDLSTSPVSPIAACRTSVCC